MFASFKYGDGEIDKNGRLFNLYNETSFAHLINKHPFLQLVKMYVTKDVRENRIDEQWLNVFLRRG